MPRPAHTLACASPLCPPHRGRHTQACLDDTGSKCDGCLPRLAVDGGYLCQLCSRLLAEDPATLAGRYAALERVLAGGGQGSGVHVSTSRDPNLQLNQAAVEARARIRDELAGLVKLICEERGVHLPTRRRWSVPPRPSVEGGLPLIGPLPLVAGPRFFDTSVSALAGMVSKHAGWLAAHRAAGEHAQVLRELVRGSFAVAYPNGTRLFPVRIPRPRGVSGWPGVASCPASVRVRVAFAVSRRGVASEVLGPEPCPGSLWTVLRPRDDRLPAELLCNYVESHRWPAREWLRLGATLAKQVAAAVAEARAVEDGRPGRQVLPDVADLEAGTVREVTGRGFVLRCRVCARVPAGVSPPSYSVVALVEWGVPVEALLHSWQRHVCPEGTEAA